MTGTERRSIERHDGGAVTIPTFDRRTLIVGLGATGVATARYLVARGVDVTVIDNRAVPPGLTELRASNPEVPLILESEDPRVLDGVEQVVISPGLALDTPIAAQARARGIPIVGDIELFARSVVAPVLAVTGSNGKSTVVTLLDRMLSATGLDVAAGGNLGPPALELLEEPAELYILEVSSFQLETTESLAPQAAVVLNVAADHLDRHGTFEEYAAIKSKLLRMSETAIVNGDDPLVREMATSHPNVIPYSLCDVPEGGYGVMDHAGSRWFANDDGPLMPVDDMRLAGAHNESNALAALALASVLHRDIEPQLTALREFPGLPHRCQWVGKRDGVTFINDSKATNVAATVAALRGLDGPIVLIAGGQGKGADLSPLGSAVSDRLLAAVVIGESAEQLESVFGGRCPIRRAGDMSAAVEMAAKLATSGSTVLLSPACASFDMFTDYVERGEAFIAAVEEGTK